MINPEVLVLGLLSGLRPGTSLAAVLVLLKTSRPQRPLLFFIAAGFASTWAIGMAVVGLLHGADVAVGGSTVTAVVEIALGGAALGYAAGLQRGWVQPPHHGSSNSATGASSRVARQLHDPSPGVAAAAGVGTHLPGLIYLVALNAIVSEQPGVVDAGIQVAIYCALWFVVPIASLVLVAVRPGAALAYVEAATAWVRRHQQAILMTVLIGLGGYLLVKGMASLLS